MFTVHVINARLNTRVLSARAGLSCGLAAIFLLAGANALQNAVAEGDTRSITMHHLHTNEDITITYKRNGQYDDAALEKLNWFLRDWRKNEQTKMDPHLIDLVWDVQREANTGSPIQVVCGYRSPETNAMLRHRSANTGVARFSQHMLGHAMDFYIPGISLEKVREIGLRMQRGGVGFYPTSGSPFVHMDTADIRMWPRMSREELARVFPDGRTVQIPSDGKPMAGYALALADVRKHGGMPSANSIGAARAAGVDIDADILVASNDRPRNPFAKLLGLGVKDEEDEEETVASAAPTAAPAAWNSAPGVTQGTVQASASQQAVANVPMPPKRPVLAAIERGAQAAEKATVAAAVKVADAAANVKFVRTADAAPLPPAPQAPTPAPAQVQAASPPVVAQSVVAQPLAPPSAARAPLQPSLPTQPATSNAPTVDQVIAERGYWQGPADGTIIANPGAAKLARGGQANKDLATGAIGPFASPSAKAGSGYALAYADPSGNVPAPPAASQAAPMGALRAPAQTAQPISVQTVSVPPPPASQGAQSGTTVALKRAGNQASSTVLNAGSSSVTVVKVDPRMGNPWMRAIVLSPSVHRFLTTIALGVGDLRSLATMMVKPSSAVFITFAAEPNPGLDHDRFAGSAIVFLPTVNYPGRAAALQ